jgi:hypothetical protein
MVGIQKPWFKVLINGAGSDGRRNTGLEFICRSARTRIGLREKSEPHEKIHRRDYADSPGRFGVGAASANGWFAARIPERPTVHFSLHVPHSCDVFANRKQAVRFPRVSRHGEPG